MGLCCNSLPNSLRDPENERVPGRTPLLSSRPLVTWGSLHIVPPSWRVSSEPVTRPCLPRQPQGPPPSPLLTVFHPHWPLGAGGVPVVWRKTLWTADVNTSTSVTLPRCAEPPRQVPGRVPAQLSLTPPLPIPTSSSGLPLPHPG